MQDLNTLSVWFPFLKDSDVPVPETKIVHIGHDAREALLHLLDGHTDSAKPVAIYLFQEAYEFDLPLFMRTGQTSAKFYWNETCYLEKWEDFFGHVHGLVEFSMIQNPPLSIGEWVFREYIPVMERFRAFQGNMPISHEWRYFFEDGEVICGHPYWPYGAFEGYQNTSLPKDEVKKIVGAMATSIVPELGQKTQQVADHFQKEGMTQAWSLDWMQSEEGTWYAIDMALAKDSYHDPECPHRFEKEQDQGESKMFTKEEANSRKDFVSELVHEEIISQSLYSTIVYYINTNTASESKENNLEEVEKEQHGYKREDKRA